jgi:4-amino-4-deoxy-L-arabinose transferase-like glycosyltransferase
MKKRREKTNILLCLIIVFTFLIRIWQLDKIPAGFFCDEASIGYNAYSILKFAKDEWGEKLPIFFKAFGEYKNPLDIYFTVIPVMIFGLNEFSVRLTSVIFNTLSTIIIFLIGKKLKNDNLGLIMALFFSIAPWSIHLSRVNVEGLQIYMCLFLISFLFLIKFFKDKKKIFLFLTSFLLAITSYSYFPARIFTLLFFLLSTGILLITKKIKLWEFILSFLIYTLICIPLISHILIGQGLTRFSQVSLFNLKEMNPVKKIALSYLLHFSPGFLFIKGDAGMNGQFITRHSVLGFGQFYIWQAFFRGF